MHCRRHGRPLLIFEDDALPAPEWQEHLKAQLQRAPYACDVLLLGWNLDSCLQLSWAWGRPSRACFNPVSPMSSSSVQPWLWGNASGCASRRGLGWRAMWLLRPQRTPFNWALPLRTLPLQVPEPRTALFQFRRSAQQPVPQLDAGSVPSSGAWAQRQTQLRNCLLRSDEGADFLLCRSHQSLCT